MTSMPTIDDRMVVQFRRTGRRRASYRLDRGGRLSIGSARVVPQRECSFVGQACDCDAAGNCAGRCNDQLICVVTPVNRKHPFDF
jgi:hypothetical protein